MIYYNPLDCQCKSQIGAVCAGKKITFRVKSDFDSVIFVFKKDGSDVDNFIPMKKEDDGYYSVEVSFDVGLYFYCFSLGNGKFIGLGDGFLGVITDKPLHFQLIAYDSEYKVPEWFSGGIIYQIFPDRFNCHDKNKTVEEGKILHSNYDDLPIFEPNEKGKVLNRDFFGGDLLGIVDKLDYLKSLGVSIIYLNPIFKSYSNHRYDTGDYMTIDPMLGNENDFILLIEKANALGIKIILDGVFNHTGDDSVYFNKYGNYPELGAYQSKHSKYYKWYNFKDYPNDYESWWGILTLPAINEANEDYIEFITGVNGVIDHYTKLGIGGWRLDVVDELPDNFVKKIRESAKRVNNDAIIIGEVWEDASNKIAYGVRREYFQGEELDSVMNYPLMNAIIDFVKHGNSLSLGNVVKEQIDHYPSAVLHSLMNILSTHDTIRLLTAVGGKDMTGKSKREMSLTKIPKENFDNAIFKLKVASLLQYTLSGVPSLYYGDEVGMQGYVDPLNRCYYPWGKENQELLSWYKFLGELRTSFDAFKDGGYSEIYCKNGVFIFERKGKNSEVLIAVNLQEEDFLMYFDDVLYNLIDSKESANKFELKAKSFAVLIKK